MTAIDPHRCCPREARARRVARWWLAGLLVGCLLPASLSAAESPRATERLVQICIMAPAVIRAHTMLKACRHRLARHPLKTRPKPSSPSVAWSAPMLVPVAALDVVSRRGPPDIA